MKILYFSWIKDKVGINEEVLEIDEEVNTVQKLNIYLKQKGKNYDLAFEDLETIKFSVNLKNAKLSDSIKSDDEVAFFPPMTGG